MFANRKAMPVASLLIVLLCVGLGVFVASCDGPMFQRMFPSGPKGPQPAVALIPGAEYVGMDKCVVCHDKQSAEFRGAKHASFTVFIEKDPENQRNIGEGCESCHGPGSLHIAGRGDKSKILKTDWRTCTACHLEKATNFSKRYHHPVPEGRITCADCHDPHKGMAPVSRVEAINKTCFGCHPDKRGPWVFPHDAIRENGCVECHEVHGSDIRKMLKGDVTEMCLKCHFDFKNHPNIGTVGHSSFIPRGCDNCHFGMHGSNFDRHLRTQ